MQQDRTAKTSPVKRVLPGTIVLLVLGILLSPVCHPRADTTASAVLPIVEKPIPEKGFKSWSLFVICSGAWLRSQDSSQLENFYHQFLAYGDAIGPEHAAVWFWSHPPSRSNRGHLDRPRNANFCASLKLKPSQSPYLIFTTRYPGEALAHQYPKTFPSISDLGNHFILSLDGVSAEQVTQILSKLADNLVTGKIQDLKVDSRQYWSAWRGAYEAVRGEIVGLTDKVTVSFDAGPVKTELKLSAK